ncbi:hypothetical protein BJ508DRAFT_313217 [Ascobolus immersus RN42]|uniref:Uncharacterized protein n=1 Tax=Ascobolus immersus RN42 TaxID=1160509 RepID=A0A3N4HJK4_ASCIM|nr:hypothetical protein BJ508DRAFT_313217 [Ascobolus immersus RN42]
MSPVHANKWIRDRLDRSSSEKPHLFKANSDKRHLKDSLLPHSFDASILPIIYDILLSLIRAYAIDSSRPRFLLRPSPRLSSRRSDTRPPLPNSTSPLSPRPHLYLRQEPEDRRPCSFDIAGFEARIAERAFRNFEEKLREAVREKYLEIAKVDDQTRSVDPDTLLMIVLEQLGQSLDLIAARSIMDRVREGLAHKCEYSSYDELASEFGWNRKQVVKYIVEVLGLMVEKDHGVPPKLFGLIETRKHIQPPIPEDVLRTL